MYCIATLESGLTLENPRLGAIDRRLACARICVCLSLFLCLSVSIRRPFKTAHVRALGPDVVALVSPESRWNSYTRRVIISRERATKIPTPADDADDDDGGGGLSWRSAKATILPRVAAWLRYGIVQSREPPRYRVLHRVHLLSPLFRQSARQRSLALAARPRTWRCSSGLTYASSRCTASAAILSRGDTQKRRKKNTRRLPRAVAGAPMKPSITRHAFLYLSRYSAP